MSKNFKVGDKVEVVPSFGGFVPSQYRGHLTVTEVLPHGVAVRNSQGQEYIESPSKLRAVLPHKIHSLATK